MWRKFQVLLFLNFIFIENFQETPPDGTSSASLSCAKSPVKPSTVDDEDDSANKKASIPAVSPRSSVRIIEFCCRVVLKEFQQNPLAVVLYRPPRWPLAALKRKLSADYRTAPTANNEKSVDGEANSLPTFQSTELGSPSVSALKYIQYILFLIEYCYGESNYFRRKRSSTSISAPVKFPWLLTSLKPLRLQVVRTTGLVFIKRFSLFFDVYFVNTIYK